ncbi:MAG: glycoside hydrolase family protein [Anaerolineae bacterium]|nr:glycoside hydrolase family protein [Anaerolineae bacterium]
MLKTKSPYQLIFILLITVFIPACRSIPLPILPTLVPTANIPPDERVSPDPLALIPTFTPGPGYNPETAGLTPGDPYRTAEPTNTSPLPTRTPTRTQTPTITPTLPPTPIPPPTFPPTEELFTRTPISIPNDGPTFTPTLTPIPSATPTPIPQISSPRKGFAASLYSQDNLVLGQWRYIWSPYVPPEYQVLQHVPMLVSRPSNGLPSIPDIQLADSRTNHNYWLVFNECEHQNQCNTSPQAAADFYHNQVVEIMYNQGADPDAKLIVGGVNAHPCGIKWLRDFVTHYQDNYGPLPHAGWHFHLYPEIRPGDPVNCTGNWMFDDTLFPDPQTAFNLWRQHAYNALSFVQTYGQRTDEIWFTEMGCLNYGNHQVPGPVCQADGFMMAYAPLILNWLNGEGRWVTRYAWYTDYSTGYFKATMLLSEVFPYGHTGPLPLSELGQYYSRVTPTSAVPLPWP